MARFSHLGSFDPARIQRLTHEVARRAKARRDVIADRSALKLHVLDGALVLEVGGLKPTTPDGPTSEMFTFRRGSLTQLANVLDVPMKFFDRLDAPDGKLREDVPQKHLDLFADLANGLLAREHGRHTVRLLDGQVDAILSDRYRSFRNDDLLIVALTEFQRLGVDVWDMRCTPDEFRVVGVAPHVKGEVSLDRTFDPGDGWLSRWAGKEGDVLNAAITIGNSETGRGSFYADPSILRKVCQNFNVWGDRVTRVHLGAKAETDGEIFVSDETRRKEDAIVFCKIRDAIRHTFDPKEFQKRLDIINATTRVEVPKATEWVDATIGGLGLPEELREAILEEFLSTGDRTQFGLVQAITAQANPENRGDAGDELVSLLEDAGGKLLRMSKEEFLGLVPA